MSVTVLQKTYNTVRACAKTLCSSKIFLPGQKRFLPIHLEKNIFHGVVSPVNKMVRTRDKFLLTTYPKISTVVNEPLFGEILNIADDVLKFI